MKRSVNKRNNNNARTVFGSMVVGIIMVICIAYSMIPLPTSDNDTVNLLLYEGYSTIQEHTIQNVPYYVASKPSANEVTCGGPSVFDSDGHLIGFLGTFYWADPPWLVDSIRNYRGLISIYQLEDGKILIDTTSH